MIWFAFNTKVAFSPVMRGGRGLMFVCVCELAQKNVLELKEEEINTDREIEEAMEKRRRREAEKKGEVRV